MTQTARNVDVSWEHSSDCLDLGVVPPIEYLPRTMWACTIRKEREGSPLQALQVENIQVPELSANEVLVLVMAAGVNYNAVWLAQGKPVSAFRLHRDAFHIPGSDAAGIVWRVGSAVRRWRPGDQVVIHCNQSCGECPECNGLDPMACQEQRIWGYETNWGSFAQFTRVQAQQLLPKPTHLSWEDAASYGLTFFTAYRMLTAQANVQPGERVLIWGAAGGLGVFATQLCLLMGAIPIAVVSSPEKEQLVRSLGAELVLNRSGFDLAYTAGESRERTEKRNAETRRFGRALRELTGGRDPEVVFEHVGAETFPASVFLASRFGRIVICGATSGYELAFDVRHLWMRQKKILGSHFANAYQAHRANELVLQKKIRPVVDLVLAFHEIPRAHQMLFENTHKGKLAVRIQAPAGPL